MITLIYGCGENQFQMVAESMEPTIKKGEMISADLSIYKTQLPERWDIVLFNSPTMPETNWTMRIVGLPGEVINYDSLGILIDGQRLTPLIPGIKYIKGIGSDTLSHPYTIPENNYYVIGDNVDNSYDSRFWGAVAIDKIFGKVTIE